MSLKRSEQKLNSRFFVVELKARSLLLVENQLSYQKRPDQKLNSRVNFRLLKRFRGMFSGTDRNGVVFTLHSLVLKVFVFN